ncbi:hypothetical protein [Candidatus Methylocalor cossyra]|uniref:Uncharacterized protein n=1 Tax=Candidatus Methylocalor cossyra TaxID=3108543 RepID=A0ABM9NLT4_9GAMM
MPNDTVRLWWHCIRRVLAVLRRPGGPQALARHLDALEREMRATASPLRYCTECGSTDFEPTATRADHGRVRILKLRCRACGHIDPY